MDTVAERISDARRALATLQELVEVGIDTTLYRDAALMRFTYSFDTVWKAARAFLKVREVQLLSEEDAEKAMKIVDGRNEVVHAYREDLAKEIAGCIPDHAAVMDRWLAAMETRAADV